MKRVFKMNHQKLIYSGLILLSASLIIPGLIVMWGIYNSFESLRTSQTAGIGAVGGGIGVGVIASFAGLIGFVIGVILIVVGFMKANRQAK